MSMVSAEKGIEVTSPLYVLDISGNWVGNREEMGEIIKFVFIYL